MKRLLTAVCALTLSAGLLTACSESKTDRMGERPGDRTPSASPPTTTMPSTPPATTPPPSSTPSSPSDSAPSGTPPK